MRSMAGHVIIMHIASLVGYANDLHILPTHVYMYMYKLFAPHSKLSTHRCSNRSCDLM